MKSPTSTILQSIQALKSKLRNDHYELQGIRRDFAMGPTRPIIIETDQRSQSPVLANLKSNSSLEKNARAKLLQLRKNHQKQTRQLHEHYKKQKQQLIKNYEDKISQITKIFEQKINEQVSYITLLQEQAEQFNYQVEKINKSTSPLKKYFNIKICPNVYEINCTEMTFDNKINFKLFQNSSKNKQKTNNSGLIIDTGTQKLEQETIKYERIVNKLLNENAALLQSVETLKMQNRRLIHDSMVKQNKENDQIFYKDSYRSKGQQKSITQSRSSQYLSVMPLVLQNQYQSFSRMSNPPKQVNKNRLKFSKASERVKTQTDRSYSSIGNQNIDLSNIQYRTTNSIEKYEPREKNHEQILEEDEQSILCEQMKLKTIKHFMKAVSHRSTQCQDSTEAHIILPQMAIKKGLGLRNALRKISMV